MTAYAEEQSENFTTTTTNAKSYTGTRFTISVSGAGDGAGASVSNTGPMINAVTVHFIPHTHGATITATCGNTEGCPLADNNYTATLTISAPTLTTSDRRELQHGGIQGYTDREQSKRCRRYRHREQSHL
jgi:hypothetical protein